MKVHAFRVVRHGPRRIEDIIQDVLNLSLEDRFFLDRYNGLRLEDADENGRFVFMDFANQRSAHGPGRMARDAPLSEFNMRRGETFGEDTAVIYDKQTDYAAIQFNFSGPRHRAVELYLSARDLMLGGLRDAADGEPVEATYGFTFGAVLKPDGYRRLRRMQVIREFEYEVAVPGIQPGDRESGRPLSDALGAPLPEGTETIRVAIKAGRAPKQLLSRDGAMQIIDRIADLPHGVLRRAVVRGRSAEDEPIEPIDLLEDRLVGEVPVTAGRGLRYSRQDRWGALQQIVGEWLESGALPVPP